MRSILGSSLTNQVRDREAALRARYDRLPGSSWVTSLAWTESSDAADPPRGVVRLGLEGREVGYALEGALGGSEDAATPREIFCAAVAASFDSTVRLVAARLDVAIERLTVIVTADFDGRGALGDRETAVGLQSLRIEVTLALGPSERPSSATRIIAVADRLCVLVQTLRGSMAVEIVSGEGAS